MSSVYFIRNLIALIILTGIFFLIFYPLLSSRFILTDDGEWFLIRLTAFYQSLAEGQFPVRYLGRLNNSFGYPVANFVYPGYLYIGSVIHVLGFGFIDTMKIIIGGSLFGTGILFYLYLKKFYDIASSLIGAISFLLSPYILFDLYKRGSVGEMLAFFPAILILYSIENKYRVLLALATCLLVLSHNIIALLILPSVIAYIVMDKKIEMLKYMLLGIGMATFFWFPAIWEKKYVIFDTVAISRPEKYFISSIPWIIGGVGYVIALIGRLLISGSFTKKDKFFSILFVVSLLMATSLSSALWSVEIFSRIIQFPYRMLSLTTISGSFLIASFFHNLRNYRILIIPVIVLWIISQRIAANSVIHINRTESYYTTNEATTTVANEFMPVWVKEKVGPRSAERIQIIDGSGKLSVKIATTQSIAAVAYLEDDSTIQINTIYYPGWGVLVDGKSTQINYTNKNGLIRFSVPKGNHFIMVEFRETIARFMADVVSLIFFCFTAFLCFKSVNRFYTKKITHEF